MTKRMLIDASHKEETRVAITEGNRLIEYDYESQSRRPIKGSIFLAKVTRVEPSLQAAFVNFGGNRHGFLPFSEIHPDYFRIPVSDREALMAEQEALLKEHDEEEEALDSDEDDHEDDSEDDAVDEIIEPDVVGGEVPALEEDDDAGVPAEASDADGDEKPAKKKRAPRKSTKAAASETVEIVQKDSSESDKKSEPSKDESKESKPKAKTKAKTKKADAKKDDNADAKDDSSAKPDEKSEGADQAGETSDDAKQDTKSKEDDGKGKRDNNRRRGNQRGRGRGRGRGNYRNNKNVEVVGGEDSDDEQKFRFNLRRKYKIQEVIKRGQIMLVQANKEERGNKGAAVGTYLSLPGRYCVLMPNSPRGGGVSRKIANHKDRARMRDVVKSLDVPKGMSVIVRTAGVTRTKAEIKRDLDYLMRLWNNIRELTLESSAPATVYEEADLIKRSVRDHYTRDVEEILVSGENGYRVAKDFMKMLIPSHIKKVVRYENDQLPLFHRYQIESQIDEIGQVEVRLKSGGYLVINPTEALISIDVNSGKSTKGRHIEETAVKTNLEAAEEVARQLKLRDLGGLVVIDFIDMEDRRNNSKVERRMKDALSTDRARVQVGRISSFGLMELSRQRLSASLTEAQYEKCNNCSGLGAVRTPDAMSIMVLRAIEEEGIRARAAQIIVQVTNEVALYILNFKRTKLAEIEARYGFQILLRVDDTLPASECRVEVSVPKDKSDQDDNSSDKGDKKSEGSSDKGDKQDGDGKGSRRRGRRGGRGRGKRNSSDDNNQQDANASDNAKQDDQKSDAQKSESDGNTSDEKAQKPKRRQSRRKKSDNDEVQQASGPDASGGNVANDDAQGDVKADDKPKKRPARKKAAPKAEASEKPAVAESSEDTKPKEAPKSAAKAKEEASAPEKKASAKKEKPPAAKKHEVVNKEPKEKKKGWWNRLVE